MASHATNHGHDADRSRLLVRCPRCGYDQRGVLATWSESCPLEGVCSECGLALSWSEVLQPEKYEPIWCVEFAKGSIFRVLRAAAVTAITSLWPWRLFTQLKMSHPIRWRRLILYVLFLLTLPLAMYMVEQSIVAIRVRWMVGQEVQVVNHSYLAAIVEAVFAPVSRNSLGTCTDRWGMTTPYPPPAGLHSALLGFRSAMRESIEIMLAGWVVGTTMWLLMPASLVLLPISRRRAKVRWAHIGRVLMYAAIIPMLVAAACVGAFAIGMVGDDWQDLAVVAAVLIAWPGYWLLNVAWWWAAIGRYLRIPHPAVVAITLGILCLLLIPFLGVFCATGSLLG
jgi:hypothetical protein